MKIYNEVVIDMNPDSSSYKKVLYEDSFEHNGDVMHLRGDRYGDDELRDQDDDTKVAAFGILDSMKSEYQQMINPQSGFFAGKLKDLTKDAERQKEQAQEQFELAKQQGNRAFSGSVAEGQMTYQQALADNKANVKNLMAKSQESAIGARDEASHAAYAMSITEGAGGLAGVGERARKTLAVKKGAGVDAIALGLKMQKEDADRQLAKTEQGVSLSRTNAASSLQSQTEAADFQLTATRENVGAELEKGIKDIAEQRAKLGNKFIQDALTLQGTTVSGFKDQRSSWMGDNSPDSNSDNDGDIEDSGDNKWSSWLSNDQFETEFNRGLDI